MIYTLRVILRVFFQLRRIMMNKRLSTLLLVSLLGTSSQIYAHNHDTGTTFIKNITPVSHTIHQQPSKESVKKLLELRQEKQFIQQAYQSLIADKFSVAKLPLNLDKQTNIIVDLIENQQKAFLKALDWNELEPELIKLYQDIYTQAEVDAQIQFYSSPEGQSIVKKNPQFFQQSQAIMAKRLASVSAETQENTNKAIKQLMKTVYSESMNIFKMFPKMD